MEKRLEVASTWVQVRKIEAATAKLKLARLQAEPAEVSSSICRDDWVCGRRKNKLLRGVANHFHFACSFSVCVCVLYVPR